MGSVRGIVISVAAMAPSQALAQVCEQVRPLWSPGSEATGLGELIALMGTPPSLALLIASALAFRFRHQWGALVVVVLWTVWSSIVALSEPGETMQNAINEGCVGAPTLFIVAVVAICVGLILYTAPRNKET